MLKKPIIDGNNITVVFGPDNENYRETAEYNILFLKNMLNWSRDKLNHQGYFFFNDLLDALGMPRLFPEGQSMGWLATEVIQEFKCDIHRSVFPNETILVFFTDGNILAKI